MISFDKAKDHIAIIAPASPPPDGMTRLNIIKNILEGEGFKCIHDPDIFKDSSLKFFAASYEIRLKTFKEALLDPKVKIILPCRGGYGSGEFVFDCLDIVPSGPKILISFSDATVLHFLFNQQYNMPTIHGSMLTPSALPNPAINADSIATLKGQPTKFNLTPINSKAIKNRELSGITTGGNLTLICNMIGTPLSPQLKGKIVILEDVNEAGYHVHRHLLHLKNAGLLDDLTAIIFGDFTKSDEHLDEAIAHFCLNHIPNIPAFRTAGIGHGEVNNPFVLGSLSNIKDNILSVPSPFKMI